MGGTMKIDCTTSGMCSPFRRSASEGVRHEILQSVVGTGRGVPVRIEVQQRIAVPEHETEEYLGDDPTTDRSEFGRVDGDALADRYLDQLPEVHRLGEDVRPERAVV